MEWKTLERPSYFGKHRDEKISEYNSHYGTGNWRLVWQWGDCVLNFLDACIIYEDSYYADSKKRPELWQQLRVEAKDIYDHEPSDVESGLDYAIQKGYATHLQDIAIRRVMVRNGWRFSGDSLIQVRSHCEYWGQLLSPGKVSFHRTELIVQPNLEGWWDTNSVEDFYQSNKLLQAKNLLIH
jgi:hypothetical protein